MGFVSATQIDDLLFLRNHANGRMNVQNNIVVIVDLRRRIKRDPGKEGLQGD